MIHSILELRPSRAAAALAIAVSVASWNVGLPACSGPVGSCPEIGDPTVYIDVTACAKPVSVVTRGICTDARCAEDASSVDRCEHWTATMLPAGDAAQPWCDVEVSDGLPHKAISQRAYDRTDCGHVNGSVLKFCR